MPVKMTSSDACRTRVLVITDAFSRTKDAASRASLNHLLRLEMETLRELHVTTGASTLGPRR